MRFFGVASAVDAAVDVISSGREAAWEDILTGRWLPHLRGQFDHRILGKDRLDGSEVATPEQAAALATVDELLCVITGPDGRPDVPHLRQLVADAIRLSLQEKWEWCATPPPSPLPPPLPFSSSLFPPPLPAPPPRISPLSEGSSLLEGEVGLSP